MMTKTTLDTNVFLYGTISTKCAELISSTFGPNSYNIVLISVLEEMRKKLMELNQMLTIFEDEMRKNKNILKQLESEMYKRFRTKYPQIYDSFHKLISTRKPTKGDLRRIILNINSDIKYFIQIGNHHMYPTRREDFESMRKTKTYESCISKIQQIISNSGDQVHLALCDQFIIMNLKNKDKLLFFTFDKKDFLRPKNKAHIEKTISNLKVKTLNLNLENIQISF